MEDQYGEYQGRWFGGFVIGMLTGAVLGAGLGLLFAPKRGSELRHQISEKAISAKETATDGVRRASDTAKPENG